VANSLHDRSSPQDEGEPFHEFIGAFLQPAPRYEQSILEGSLFPIKSNVDNETVEFPLAIRNLSSGGGRRNSRLEFFYSTSSVLFRKAFGATITRLA
jgi:hypothetical protein